MKKLKNLLLHIPLFISNLLVKEDQRIERLLKIEPEKMYLLLPRPKRSIEKGSSAVFDYENGVVRTIVKSIKFNNNLALKRRTAVYLYDELTSIISDAKLFSKEEIVITPMPMSDKEKRKRGFNQCEEILREVNKMSKENLNIKFDILEKTRETERQVKLNREERLKNLYKSMRVKKEKIEKIKNKTVLVFDDVYTTGSTFAEARRALLYSGAHKVLGLFLAH